MAPHTDRAKRGLGHPDEKGEPARKGEKKIEGGTVIVRKLWNEGIEEGEMAWRLSWRKPERLCSFGDKKARGKGQKGKLWRRMKGKKEFLTRPLWRKYSKNMLCNKFRSKGWQRNLGSWGKLWDPQPGEGLHGERAGWVLHQRIGKKKSEQDWLDGRTLLFSRTTWMLMQPDSYIVNDCLSTIDLIFDQWLMKSIMKMIWNWMIGTNLTNRSHRQRYFVCLSAWLVALPVEGRICRMGQAAGSWGSWTLGSLGE